MIQIGGKLLMPKQRLKTDPEGVPSGLAAIR